MKHEDLTEKIIGKFYRAYNNPGYGFPEKVYENAFCIELGKIGLNIERQKRILVHYRVPKNER
jgi:GxxExxY protein